MSIEIKTLEELRGYNGRKVTCTIGGTDVDDCLVSIDDGVDGRFMDAVYLLQNEFGGTECTELKGYTCSWVVTDNNFDYLSSIFLVETSPATKTEDIEQPSYYYKDSPNKPDWFDGRPVLCYYSDQSEEDAVEKGRLGLLVMVDSNDVSYPFRVNRDYDSIEDYLEHDVDHYDLADYTYVVPVVRENEELKALKEQRDELDRKIAKMENIQ